MRTPNNRVQAARYLGLTGAVPVLYPAAKKEGKTIAL